MPDPNKKSISTEPKASAVTGGGRSNMVQVPAGRGASRWVSKDSPQGKKILQAKKALDLKKKGKKLLQSEKKNISKSFNPTKVRKEAPKTKKYKK